MVEHGKRLSRSLLVLAVWCTGCSDRIHVLPSVENQTIRLRFNDERHALTSIENRLTGEVYPVTGDDFAIEIEEYDFAQRGASGPKVTNLTLTPRDLKLKQVKHSQSELEIQLGDEIHIVTVHYRLLPSNNFFEKRLRFKSTRAFGFKRVVISTLDFRSSRLVWMRYPYQKNVTFFGRSAKGGLFTGVELPFDRSSVGENGQLELAYVPHFRGVAAETMETEPAYVGVYRRRAGETPSPGLPLASESDAMLAMTSQILGPPRHGLMPIVCGWWSELSHGTYNSPADVEADMRSIDFIADCGINWVLDSHPWSGETELIHSLAPDQKYKPGKLAVSLLEHASKKGVKVIFWPTLNNSNPWFEPGQVAGKPLRPDRPEWLISPPDLSLMNTRAAFLDPFPPLHSGPQQTGSSSRIFSDFVRGNCLAVRPFQNWLVRVQLDCLSTGYFDGWAVDGDFFGGGGNIEPVSCPSRNHDHLPNDSNYACEAAANRLASSIRQAYPRLFMMWARPLAALGVWSIRHVDACFSLGDSAEVKFLDGIGARPINVELGDRIRTLSRIRVQRHFFPHYQDQSQVFAAPKSMNGGIEWSSEALDYILLSALSASPNQLYYLPTKAGIPERDKQIIRKWLTWGRSNIKYLQVRKDLDDWPSAGKVDAFAHLVGDRGFVFLFNPNAQKLSATFKLDDNLGLTAGESFEISQVHPPGLLHHPVVRGDEIQWAIPPRTAVIIQVEPRLTPILSK
ncbi:MAG: hypothetical protein L0387_35605 [Acidobacteria bacterium]|nr:hypothetical protein [Acidobacteriota bacterium]MCI0723624.1 hypothetical protein [Acidobacteriota bacterium]